MRLFSDIYDNTYVRFQGANYPLFYVLQHISTVLGLSLVVLYIAIMKPQKAIGISTPRIGYWLLVFAIAIAVLRLRFLVQPSDYNLGNVVVSGITGLIVGTILCGFINFKKTIPYQKSLNG